jgi:hypothetical protein
MSSDPLARVYAACEAADCQPHGPEHNFTARCPAHDDRRPSLSVREGADGRVLVWCFAGCPTEDVVPLDPVTWKDRSERRSTTSPRWPSSISAG